jgi:hypothetical protein
MMIGAIVVVVVIVAVLAVPIVVRFDVAWDGALEQRFELSWAFGLVRTSAPQADDRPLAASRSGRKSDKGLPARSRQKRAHVLTALRLKPFRRRVMRFIGSLWRAVRKESVRVTVRVGLGDPADTGRLWALVGPCAGLLQQIPDVAVSVVPDFDNVSFELDSSGTIRVVPLTILLLVAGLFVSPSVWHGVRVLRRGS